MQIFFRILRHDDRGQRLGEQRQRRGAHLAQLAHQLRPALPPEPIALPHERPIRSCRPLE